jgi:hypothetical protein
MLPLMSSIKRISNAIIPEVTFVDVILKAATLEDFSAESVPFSTIVGLFITA